MSTAHDRCREFLSKNCYLERSRISREYPINVSIDDAARHMAKLVDALESIVDGEECDAMRKARIALLEIEIGEYRWTNETKRAPR